jgi:hypothetical protein
MKFVEKLFLKDLRFLARIVLYFFLILGLLIFVIHGLIVLGFQYPLDYGEGPLLNQALRVVQGNPLYPEGVASPPYLVSNYPPIYVLINALFVALFGPTLAIGRLISFVSTLGSAMMIALIIQHFSGPKRLLPMLAGASIFLITPYVLEWSPLFRIDMLGLFLSLAGLYIVIRNPAKNRNLLFAAALFILAAYTRQSYGLAAPFAGIIYVFTKNKRGAVKLLLAYGLGGLAIFGLLYWVTDGAFFFHIISANVNPFRWETVWNFARDILSKMPFILFLGGVYLVIGWRLTKTYAILYPYMLASALAALTIGKVGSNINYLVEISAAFGLLMGFIFARFSETLAIDPSQKPDFDFPMKMIPAPEDVPNQVRWKMWVNLLIFILLVGITVLQVAELSRDSLFGPIASHRDRIKQAGNDYAYIEERIRQASEEGYVLADEYMAMLPKNNIPLYIQPFEMTQLASAGLWDQTTFLRSIQQQEFPLILIHHFPFYPVYLERWTTEMQEAIFENYVAVDMRANSLLFEPKDNQTTAYPENMVCPDAPFQLPTQADMGMYWKDGQVLMLGNERSGEIPVFAVADGFLYQFPEWDTAVAIQHEDPLDPGNTIWSFYGDLAPAFDKFNPIIETPYIKAKGIPVKAGDLIGYQGRWLGPSQQTWVHLRFTLLPASKSGDFPEVFLPIEDFFADLPGIEEQLRLGLDGPVSLSTYTGLPESKFFGVLDFLPFTCKTEGD